MDEDDQKPKREEAIEPPPIHTPSHEPLPLPPDINFTRPTLGRGPSSPSRSPRSKPGESGRNENRDLGDQPTVHLGLGIAATTSFAGAIWAGAYLGEKIDAHWNHAGTPWGTIIMTLAGTVAGFFNMYRLLFKRTGKK